MATYLSPGVTPDAVAALFVAAAALHRTKPWDVVPSDTSVIEVTVPALGLERGILSVIGQAGDSTGFVLFDGVEDFEAYLDGAREIDRGEEPEIPPHMALNFERSEDLPASPRREIAEHGWEVAAPDAYPWPVVIDESLVVADIDPEGLTLTEALCRALAAVTPSGELADAWEQGHALDRGVTVETHAGAFEVHLRAPSPADAGEDALTRGFRASPEAESLEVGAYRLVAGYAAEYFGAGVTKLKAAQLREIVFEILPRKVMVDAAEGREILHELRALYAYLKRAHQLPQADACLAVLGGDAEDRLTATLADPRNFGMAKSLVGAGKDAGFDVDTQSGLDAWMREVQSRGPVPTSIFAGGPRPVPSGSQQRGKRDKKAKRKAARKARKKNR